MSLVDVNFSMVAGTARCEIKVEIMVSLVGLSGFGRTFVFLTFLYSLIARSVDIRGRVAAMEGLETRIPVVLPLVGSGMGERIGNRHDKTSIEDMENRLIEDIKMTNIYGVMAIRTGLIQRYTLTSNKKAKTGRHISNVVGLENIAGLTATTMTSIVKVVSVSL